MKDNKIIVVLNSKGGASKSTTAMQIASAYFLYKSVGITLYEIDKKNEDNLVFKETKIETKQVTIENDGIDAVEKIKGITNNPNENNSIVIDVGGNLTTELVINALRKSRMYRKIDLFIIPMSGGGADLKNAISTYEEVLEFHPDAQFLFVLSRVRKKARVKLQFDEFFGSQISNKFKYIVFEDSDTIDLSRKVGKTVYEIATDTETKKALEKAFDDALDTNNNEEIDLYSELLSVYDESITYLDSNLKPAFKTLDAVLETKHKIQKDI